MNLHFSRPDTLHLFNSIFIGLAFAFPCLGWTQGNSFRPPIPSDISLLKDSDCCVVSSEDNSGSAVVEEVVFGGGIARGTKFSFPTLGVPNVRWIAFMKQDVNELRLTSFRMIVGDQVRTAEDTYEREPWWKYNSAQFEPMDRKLSTLLKDYVAEIQRMASLERTERLARHRDILNAIVQPHEGSSEQEYKRVNALSAKIREKDEVHADDEDTLEDLSEFVVKCSASKFMHVREDFMSIIYTKNYTCGFDAIRVEAFRCTDDDWNWFSESDAMSTLTFVGNEKDIEFMQNEMDVLTKRENYQYVVGVIFRDIGPLAARIYPEGSNGRNDLRLWLERFCANPTAMERRAGCHVWAAVALGQLGTEATIEVLKAVAVKEHDYQDVYERAINEIKVRLKSSAKGNNGS